MENNEELVSVSKKDLIELVRDSLKLNALENGGVNNWIDYSDSLWDKDNFGGESFNDIDDLEIDEFYNNYVSCYVKEKNGQKVVRGYCSITNG